MTPSEAAQILGRQGGKATAKNRTRQERIDAAKHAINRRWDMTSKADRLAQGKRLAKARKAAKEARG